MNINLNIASVKDKDFLFYVWSRVPHAGLRWMGNEGCVICYAYTIFNIIFAYIPFIDMIISKIILNLIPVVNQGKNIKTFY